MITSVGYRVATCLPGRIASSFTIIANRPICVDRTLYNASGIVLYGAGATAMAQTDKRSSDPDDERSGSVVPVEGLGLGDVGIASRTNGSPAPSDPYPSATKASFWFYSLRNTANL